MAMKVTTDIPDGGDVGMIQKNDQLTHISSPIPIPIPSHHPHPNLQPPLPTRIRTPNTPALGPKNR
ncbi:MAG: hypothetical protein Q9169_002643 [Polycauliona sp. 2 TL-2023]